MKKHKKRIQPKRLAYLPFHKAHLYAAVKSYAALEGYSVPNMAAVLIEVGARTVGIYPRQEQK